MPGDFRRHLHPTLPFVAKGKSNVLVLTQIVNGSGLPYQLPWYFERDGRGWLSKQASWNLRQFMGFPHEG